MGEDRALRNTQKAIVETGNMTGPIFASRAHRKADQSRSKDAKDVDLIENYGRTNQRLNLLLKLYSDDHKRYGLLF
jgi:hypothetical protein